MGRQERLRLISKTTTLLVHLLKLIYRKEAMGDPRLSSGTIGNERIRIDRLLKDNPSLGKNKQIFSHDGKRTDLLPPDWYVEAWSDAREIASYETGLDVDTFPKKPIWSFHQIMQKNWLPEEERK